MEWEESSCLYASPVFLGEGGQEKEKDRVQYLMLICGEVDDEVWALVVQKQLHYLVKIIMMIIIIDIQCYV